MATKKHLIIGCGTSALSALEAIREVNSTDEVKLVTMEDCLPYSPASLPYIISGKITEAELWMKGEDYFKNMEATLARGKEVAKVDAKKKKVSYRDGGSDSYDTLLIASGAEPVLPPVKGLKESGAQGFRTLADCRRLVQELKGKKSVAILGAGNVGMELAGALLEKGYEVTVIEKEQTVIPLYYDEEAEAYIRKIFIDHKARFLLGKTASEVNKKGDKFTVSLSDGSSLTADILISAAGVKSRVAFLDGSGVKVGSGILVDNRMKSSVDGIYAAGDVAEPVDFFTGKPKVSAILPSAMNQGKVAGTNMAGGKAEYEGGITMTVFNFLNNKAFSIGWALSRDNPGEIFTQKDDRNRKFKKLVLHRDRLIGAMFINEDIEPGVILYLIRKQVDMAPHKEALFERTKPLNDPWLSTLKFSPAKR